MAKAEQARVEAQIAGDALVVSSASSAGARIWRAPMISLSHATFELREDAGRVAVVLRPAGGVEEDVCAFPDRISAIYALDTITAALLTAGQASSSAMPPRVRGSLLWRLMKGAFYGVLAVVALGVFITLIYGRGAAPGPEAASGGGPVPAEQVIGK